MFWCFSVPAGKVLAAVQFRELNGSVRFFFANKGEKDFSVSQRGLRPNRIF